MDNQFKMSKMIILMQLNIHKIVLNLFQTMIKIQIKKFLIANKF